MFHFSTMVKKIIAWDAKISLENVVSLNGIFLYNYAYP